MFRNIHVWDMVPISKSKQCFQGSDQARGKIQCTTESKPRNQFGQRVQTRRRAGEVEDTSFVAFFEVSRSSNWD